MLINEVSKTTGISSYTLRFYEKQGLLTVPRDELGNRNYDDETIDNVMAIAHYRCAGLKVSEIKKIVDGMPSNDFLSLLKDTEDRVETQLRAQTETLHYLQSRIAQES